MEEISRSVVKKDHAAKVSGRSIYVADYPSDGVLTGRLLHAKTARAKVLGVELPELPDGYYYVDARDIPGDNNVNIVLDDMPVFCRDTVEYIGEAIGMLAGPDEKKVEELLGEIRVSYEELEPVLDMRKAEKNFFEYNFGHGDVDRAFAEADRVFDEEFETGYQEQAYLEPQGMMAEIEPDGRVFVHGSIQCVYYVHNAVKRVLGCGDEGLHVLQDVTGGGFGGKEAFPSILACQVAVAAKAIGKPVRCVFGRREDMEYTSKRHPSVCRYRAAVKDGRVTAIDADVIYNAGAYSTLSAVVLQRGLIAAPGVYNIPNVRIHGTAAKTNTTPCGAYRGFGGPQTFFAVETLMDHIARELGADALAFKEMHLAKQGDLTSTSGRYHFPVPVKEMIEEVDSACDYRRKGVRTTFSKIVAHELGLPLERVSYEHPDTGRVPDSGPTVASRSLMVVGELLRRAAIHLKEIWIDGEEQEVEERFKEPDFVLPFSIEKFEGDAYPTFAWAVNAIELEVDTFTGVAKVLGAWGDFDIGTPADYNVALGQMEGGFLQGIGYASIEKMDYDKSGRIRNNSFSDYLIPTAMDVPKLVCMFHVEKYPDGPYGAKGAGEVPLVGAPAAYLDAMEQALGGISLNHAPFTAEDVLTAIRKEAI